MTQRQGAIAVAMTGAMLAVGLGLIFAQTRPASGPISRPAQAATAPVRAAQSAPASAPADPAAQLERPAADAAAAMLKQLDGSFHAFVRPPFVVIGNLPEDSLRQMTNGSVLAPADRMYRCYFQKHPTEVITVLLFRDDKTYRDWGEKLFDDTDLPHFGYYKPDKRTLVMNISTGTGTLVHELTHALIVYDFPDVPTWFNEGLASLHECCQIEPTRIVGAANWRLPALKKAIKEKTLRSLRDLVTARDFYGANQGINYAQARYFVMYLQERGLLDKFYKEYRDGVARGKTAVEVIEAVCGADIDKVEKQFLAWVVTVQ